MKNLCYLLLSCLLASCSTVRQLERAEKLLAAHQRSVPPDTVFMQLLAANPKLKERATRTVIKVVHDTVRMAGKTVYLPAPVPQKATAQTAAVDSLVRAASRQLRVKDSLAFAMRLRAALAARPRLRSDTLKQHLGDLLIRTWFDRFGGAHSTITNLRQNTVVVQRVVPAPPPTRPKAEAVRGNRVWIFLRDHAGALVAILLIGLTWLVLLLLPCRRRARPCPYAPYSNKS